MSGELFDVVVLGPADANPVAEARLAAVLAGRIGQPLTGIAQALSEKNLSVGQSLERLAAEALVNELQSMGALTSIRRAVPAFPASGQMTPAPGQGFRPLGTPIGSLQAPAPGSGPGSGLKPSILGPAPGSGVRLGGLFPNPSSAGSMGRSPPTSPGAERGPGSGQGLRPLGVLRPDQTSPTPTPPHPRVETNPLGLKVPTGAGGNFGLRESSSSRPRTAARSMPADDPFRPPSPVATPAAPPADPFLSPEAQVASFELDRDCKTSGHRHSAVSVSGASGLNNPKMVATKATSGLEVSGAKKDYTERCPRHGLLYDTRKSSACRKCLADGRAAVDRPSESGSLRSSPGRRALLGILFAVVLGFLPAAYYARVPGMAEVNKLRAEQQQLSSKLGNEATMRRFDELEELVVASRKHSMRYTLIVWVTASGLMLGFWYKIT